MVASGAGSCLALLKLTVGCANGYAYACFNKEGGAAYGGEGGCDNDDSMKLVSVDGALQRLCWTS